MDTNPENIGAGQPSGDPADDNPIGPVAPERGKRFGLRSIVLAGYALGIAVGSTMTTPDDGPLTPFVF